MAVVWTTIRDHVSGDFSSLTQSQIETEIANAVACLNATAFGDKLDLATELLAEHELYLDQAGGGGKGVLQSAGAGPLSKSFRSNSWGDSSYLGQTRYGQRLLRLITMAGPGVQCV